MPTRRLRHWKQRYAPNAEFIWRRRCLFGGETYEPGERIPAELAVNKSKLRRFWEGQIIELAEFEAPAPVVPEPVTVTVVPEPVTVTVVPEPVTVTVVPEPETVTVVPEPETVTVVPEPETVTVVPEPETVTVAPETPGTPPWAPEPIGVQVIKPKSSSWYTVTTPDGKEHQANGPKNLQKLLIELNAVGV